MENVYTIDIENAPEELKMRSTLPTNDIVFHCLFGTKGNESITKGFIEGIIGKEIEDIDLDKNVNLDREHYEDKLGILDVRAKGKDGVNYNVEMQNATSNTLPERILAYWARLYAGDLKVGDSYEALNKTIAIIILDDKMKNLKKITNKFYTVWEIREETYRDIVFTDHFELHIVELPKYEALKTEKNRNLWLDFIRKPNGREVLEEMGTNKEVKEAVKEWEKIVADDYLRNLALRREIAQLDYNTGLENAMKEGLEKR